MSYKDYKGLFLNDFWIRRIHMLLIKINNLSDEKIDVGAVMKRCHDNSDEEFLIKMCLYYQKIYVSKYKEILEK